MKYRVTIILILFSISIFAQNGVPNDAIVVFTGNGSIRTSNFKSKPKSIEGSYYYNDQWNVGTIRLFSGERIENYPLKYDLKMNQIDIKVNNEIKTISIGLVKEIVWVDKKGIRDIFKNTSNFNTEVGIGFFLILYEGEISLLKHTKLILLESNYNQAMDVGSKSKKYLKKEKYYIYSDGKISNVKKTKKKILKVFKDKSESVKKYANENNLSFKNDSDLAKIFEYYNSL